MHSPSLLHSRLAQSQAKEVRLRAGPPSELLTTEEVAAILRCSESSLNKWRVAGNGPRFVYVGSRVRYTRSDLAEFIASSTRASTSQAGGDAALKRKRPPDCASGRKGSL